MTMLAHCVKTLDDTDSPASAGADAPQAEMTPATPAATTGEEWKADAFENMNKNVAVHNVVEDASTGIVVKKEEKSFKIVMIRHGESEWNKENRFCGWFDAGLSEAGKYLSSAKAFMSNF